MQPNRSNPSRSVFHLLRTVLLLAAFFASGACACKDGSKAGSTTGPTSGNEDAKRGDPADCDKSRDRVKALYEEQAKAEAKPDDSDEVRALRAQIVEDNTHMVMVDCRAQPGRFAPCLEAAVSVEQMERDCLIPLDDEGTVEGKAFAGQ